MLVRLLEARGFRNLDHARVELGDSITLVCGPNGAGKTNLLEALCFGLTGSSWRTSADRRLIGFGADLARVEVTVADGRESRRFLAAVSTADGRHMRLDGNRIAPVEGAQARPAVAVFSPDRLALIKGPPGGRRAHLDRLVAALWPVRAEMRRRFGRALAQRNALVSRIRSGSATEDALAAWDTEFAAEAATVVEARASVVDRLASTFGSVAASLGLRGELSISYRPRTGRVGAAEIAEQLRDRRAGDIERGYSTHGPHLDEIEIAHEGRAVRTYGSQGEQRSALLALLFAERHALLEARRTPPLMLLDDVMSELDLDRRLMLVELLGTGGQTVITATEPSQVPDRGRRSQVRVSAGRVVAEAVAA